MLTTLKWIPNIEENRPSTMRYCLILENIEDGEERARPYGAIGRALYIPKGTIIPLALCEYDFSQRSTAEQRLMTILHPDYWLTDGGFYRETDDGELYRLHDKDIPYWAELPDLPDGFGGNETDYMQDIWERYPKDASKVRIVKVK